MTLRNKITSTNSKIPSLNSRYGRWFTSTCLQGVNVVILNCTQSLCMFFLDIFLFQPPGFSFFYFSFIFFAQHVLFIIYSAKIYILHFSFSTRRASHVMGLECPTIVFYVTVYILLKLTKFVYNLH